MTNGANIKTTDYLDGFQYNENFLEFFPHPEGYVKATPTSLNQNNPEYSFNYVFNYTDHLGNVRVSYTKDPQTGKLKILDENHFYPFGLKHNKTSSFTIVSPNFVDVIVAPVVNNPYDYRFQGQELQDDHDLNWYSYRFRNYDPAIGRFFNVDPLTEEYHDWGEYVFSGNRVVDSFELEGLEPVHSGEAYGVKTTDEYGWEWVSDGEQWGIELGTATLSGSVTPALSGNFLSRFRDKTSSWSEKHLREPISRWTDNNIRQPVSGWIDYNIRQPATELTQPLKNHLNLSPEQWAEHRQLMIEWGVEAEKDNLRSTMTAFGESGLLSGSGTWGGNLGRVYNVRQIPYNNVAGAVRAAQYSKGWGNASLSKVINKFAPGSKPISTTTGKTIYKNSNSNIQVVYDKAGNYFRIENVSLPGKRRYLDLDGNIPNNKIVNGKISGRSQDEYNQVTHFNNID